MITTPQLFLEYLAGLLSTALPGWTCVSDISGNRESQDRFIVLHAGDGSVPGNVPASNRTWRIPVTAVAWWTPQPGDDADVVSGHVFAGLCEIIEGLAGGAIVDDDPEAVGCFLVAATPGAPVVSVSGVFYQLSVEMELVLQF